MSCKKILTSVFILIVLFISIFLFAHNHKQQDFLQANLLQILTFILATIISFFFVQYRTDKRRKIDCIEHMIIEMQNLIDHSENLFSFERDALILQSSIANKLKFIDDKGFSQIKNDIKYIINEFQELRDLYSNHNQSIQELSHINNDLNRHKINISTKCDKIRLTLFEI